MSSQNSKKRSVPTATPSATQSRASAARSRSKTPSRAPSSSAPSTTTSSGAPRASKKTPTQTVKVSPKTATLTKPTRAHAARRARPSSLNAPKTPSQRHSDLQAQLHRTFFNLARAEASRALRVLEMHTSAHNQLRGAENNAAAGSGQGTRALAADEFVPSEGAPMPLDVQQTLAELFTRGTHAAADRSAAETDSALADLWHLALQSPHADDPVHTDTSTATAADPPRPHTHLCPMPSRAFPALLADRVRACILHRLRYPWPYQSHPEGWPTRRSAAPPPLVMTPGLWHPRSSTTGNAYHLLHLTSSGLAAVPNGREEDERPCVSFFDLCGI